MAFPLGTPEQVAANDRCWRSKDLVTFGFTGNQIIGTPSTAVNCGTYQADQNYSIRKILISAVAEANQAGTNAGIGCVGWGRVNAEAGPFGSGFKPSTLFAALVIGGWQPVAAFSAANPNVAVYGNQVMMFDFNPDNIYLAKGQTIYLNANSDGTSANRIWFHTVLYLMPTFA